MNIKITLTAPDWMGNIVVTQAECDTINRVIDHMEESSGLDYTIYCEPSSDNFIHQRAIDFLIDDIAREHQQEALEMVHELIFEQFDVEFE